MPDHVHLLVEGTATDSDLRRFIALAKRRAASLHSRTTGSRLWQGSYYDRVLRQDDDVRSIAKYIVQNPVRAGLVAAAGEYKHSGSDVWTVSEILSE